MLAQAVREVENGVMRGRIDGTRFQVVALLVREERARLKADDSLDEQRRATELKRLDGIATILAQTAAREPSLFSRLGEDAEITDSVRRLKRELQERGGIEPTPEDDIVPTTSALRPERQVVPQSVARAQLANPFMAPDYGAVPVVPKLC